MCGVWQGVLLWVDVHAGKGRGSGPHGQWVCAHVRSPSGGIRIYDHRWRASELCDLVVGHSAGGCAVLSVYRARLDVLSENVRASCRGLQCMSQHAACGSMPAGQSHATFTASCMC